MEDDQNGRLFKCLNVLTVFNKAVNRTGVLCSELTSTAFHQHCSELWKTTKMEDDLNRRQQKLKTNKMEDDQNVDDQNRRQTKWMTTKIEDKPIGRRPKCNNRESKGHRQKQTSNLDSG